MPAPARPTRLEHLARAFAQRAVVWPLELAAALLRPLPTRWVLVLSNAFAALVWALDPRGRKASAQNLSLVFGAELSPAERRRLTRASYRCAVRSIFLLFHLQPLTPARYRSLVRVDPADDARFRALIAQHPTVVLVSGHFGNWELLLASRSVIPYAPECVYLAETTGFPSVDAFFERLRDRGAGGAGRRKRGAMALKKALEDGRSVSLLVDRNVRGAHGGIYAPFLGLPARTTPLPAKLARWNDVPLAVSLLLPEGEARWRLWISGDLRGERTDDEEADVLAATTRVNDILSRAIREHPESWTWLLKRWKSRPTPELGPYPAYSYYDPS